MKLNGKQRKFMRTPIWSKWRLERWGIKKPRWLWDGDYLLPAHVGPMVVGLADAGLLEHYCNHGTEFYRITYKGLQYQCTRCSWGYELDEDGCRTGNKCPDCDGIGVLAEPRTT